MKLRYDPRALTDLDEIFKFISDYDRSAAVRVAARLRAVCEHLTEQPKMGRATATPHVWVRSVVNYPYVVFDKIAADHIVVLHVRHTARGEPVVVG